MEDSRLATYRPTKSNVAAFLMLFLFGCFGMHRMYLDRPLSGLAMSLVSFSPMALFLFPPAAWMESTDWIVVLVVLVWMLVDAFLIPKWVREINEESMFAAVPPPLPMRR